MHLSEGSWCFSPPSASFGSWGECGSCERPQYKAEWQGWHRDVEVLWPFSATGGPLPPHCVNVFVPLTDVGEENGSTEFVPGSHLLDQEDPLVDLAGRVQPRIAAGAALIF